MPWARRASRPIPHVGVGRKPWELNDYSRGMASFPSNDSMKDGFWRLAQNARITTIGDYGTRKGFDFYSDAAGETQDQAITSNTGAADQSFGLVAWLAQKWTAGASGSLTKQDIRLKNDASATGTIIVEHWTDSGGSPGTFVARSSIAASALTSSYAYLTARFPKAPSVVSGTAYWTIVYIQADGSGSYKWSSTTSATTAKTSSNSGSTWSSASFALNLKQYYSTTGAQKGLYRATKSDGTKVTFFVHGTVLYSVNDSTGALTTVKSGLNSSATRYRFEFTNDILYYVNEFDGYRKWNFTAESQVDSTNYSNIRLHKGLMFLNLASDPNKWVFSNFADYETFTSTDFIYVPAPKTGDPSTAAISLNGSLIIWTLTNKYILSGDDNATFRLDEAPDQKGTYAQETVTNDQNFAYYLSDDGVYRTNGNEAQLLSESIYQDIVSLQNKDTTCLAVNRGRLYLYHQSGGSSYNDRCWVWNLNFSGASDTIESFDTGAYVSRAISCPNDDDKLLVGSSIVGQLYWQENTSNDYTNLGDDIEFLLQTHFLTFDAPAALKEIRYWRPRFGAQSGAYSIACEYAYDMRSNWQVVTDGNVNVQGSGYIWGSSSTVWGAFTWGASAEIQASLYVPGEYRRIGLRYKHYATRQPNDFLGHTLVVETRRMR